MNRILYVFLVLLLSGCAIGNKYDYRSSRITLPVQSTASEKVVLAVEEARPYVLSAEKNANFVGLQRGGFGNPFDVTTASGKPLTEDMSVAIARALSGAGYKVYSVEAAPPEVLAEAAARNGAGRIISMRVKEWKSDIYMSVTLHSDIVLKVFDSGGKQLAENRMTFTEAIGGAKIGATKNSQMVADEFAKRIGYLFNKKEVRDSL